MIRNGKLQLELGKYSPTLRIFLRFDGVDYPISGVFTEIKSSGGKNLIIESQQPLILSGIKNTGEENE